MRRNGADHIATIRSAVTRRKEADARIGGFCVLAARRPDPRAGAGPARPGQ